MTRAPSAAQRAAIALATLGAVLAILAAALASGRPTALVARLPALPERAIDPGIVAIADTEAQGFEAAVRRWSGDAASLAADPRWATVLAAALPGDALLDAYAADPVATRYGNVLLVARDGRVVASLFPSRRVGQRIGGSADPLARAVTTSRAMRAVGTSALAVEDGRAVVFVAAPAADGATLVLAAGPQQLAPLLELPPDGPSATIELLVSIDGQWHRLTGDPRAGYRLLRIAADAERDALLGEAATGTSGVRIAPADAGSTREATARTVPTLGAMMLLSRTRPADGLAADLAHAMSRWGVPGGLGLLAIAAWTAAARVRRRAPLRPAATINPPRTEPTISATSASRPVADAVPPATETASVATASTRMRPVPVPTAGPRANAAGGSAEVHTPTRPAAIIDRPLIDDDPSPPGATFRLADVFTRVGASRTGAGGELLLRRGPGVADVRNGDAGSLVALLEQMVDVVGSGRPGMPIMLSVERGKGVDGLVFTVGGAIDGTAPAAEAARIDVTTDVPAGWDAATTVAIDAAGRCAAALGGTLASSADTRVLVLRATLPALAPTGPTRPPFRGRRAILAVDDEATAGIVAEQLVRLGLDVHELDGYGAALDEARRGLRSGARRCDVIIVDDRIVDARLLETPPSGPDAASLPPVVLLQGRDGGPSPMTSVQVLVRPVDEPVLAAMLATLPGFADERTASAATPSGVGSTVAGGGSAQTLDIDGALRNLAGDAVLHRRLLGSFAREQRDAADVIAKLLLEGRPAQARERAHALKGAAATLGLAALAKAAGAIEATLRAGQPVPPSRLHDLRTLVATACAAAIDAALAGEGSSSSTVASNGRPQLWARFDAALAVGGMDALDIFEQLSRDRAGADWDAMRDALLVLDFERAAALRSGLD